MEKAQKEYYLNEKMKAIQKELGRKDEKGNEIEELKKKIEQSRMPKEVEEKAIQELKRLEAMPPMSAEATVSRNYLDWLIAVPWYKKTKESRDLKNADRILNEDHYGLEKIKERILEFLAVRALVKKPKATILTFVGPPGVGKTSLAKSIARAMNRKFVRLSLGGVRDEAEIRGHRRTYIGAFPGQIIQMMKKAASMNPVFLLDEVDKMSMDFRGDPSAALLEVLDPEQNSSFLDHYLDVEYDLSSVMFICTANVLHTIPQALRDRMEVLQLAGYTEEEKVQIAKRFLVPKSVEGTGLTDKNITFADEAIQVVINRYTREAGVRNLEREINSICRKVARKVVVEGVQTSEEITADKVTQYLGVPRYRPTLAEEQNEIGVATGLAWTEVGGEILVTEATLMPGRGQVDADRQARRRDAGVGAGGDELCALPRRRVRHPQGLQSPPRRAHPHSGGRDPEGRTVRRHHAGHRAGVGADAHPGPPRRGDDRRDHAARQGAADRRRQGKGPGRAPRRRQEHHPPEGQREGSGRHPEERPGRHEPVSGADDGRSVEAGAGRPADADHADARHGRRCRSRRRAGCDYALRAGQVRVRQVGRHGSESVARMFDEGFDQPHLPYQPHLPKCLLSSSRARSMWPASRAIRCRKSPSPDARTSANQRLINALVGHKVARTSAAPGKTRLANFYRVARDSAPTFRLVDLPGYGYARGGDASKREFATITSAYFGSRQSAEGTVPVAGRSGQKGTVPPGGRDAARGQPPSRTRIGRARERLAATCRGRPSGGCDEGGQAHAGRTRAPCEGARKAP